MGARATRITREELVTPPEFRGIQAVGHQAARIGGARIELVREGDETRLGFCYQQVPVRLMPPFVVSGEPASLLYLINLTAGLLGSRRSHGRDHGESGLARRRDRPVCHARSSGPGQLWTQQWTVQVEDDACLVVLPGPTIPFRDSRYFQRARVELAPRARLIWGDIWLAGRYDRGALSERFQFERIVQDFEARRDGRLIYRDRFRWDGPWTIRPRRLVFWRRLGLGEPVRRRADAGYPS